MDLKTIGISSLEDFFSYKPPTTEARKQAHQIVNDYSLATAQALVSDWKELNTLGSTDLNPVKAIDFNEETGESRRMIADGEVLMKALTQKDSHWVEKEQICNHAQHTVIKFIKDITAVVENPFCLKAIIEEARVLYNTFGYIESIEEDTRTTLCQIQKIRMFANLGITMDDSETY